MPLHDGAGNRQTKTGASDAFRFSSEKFFEDPFLVAVWKPGPPVAHEDNDSLSTLNRRDLDWASCRSIVGGILQNIDKHLFDQNLVNANQWQPRWNAGCHRTAA